MAPLRDNVMQLFFKRLTSHDEELVEAARAGLAAVVAHQRMPKQLLQVLLRPWVMLADGRTETSSTSIVAVLVVACSGLVITCADVVIWGQLAQTAASNPFLDIRAWCQSPASKVSQLFAKPC